MSVSVLSATLVAAQSPEQPLKPVKVIVNGKTHASVLEYRREKLERLLHKALADQKFRDFSEDELCGMIKSVRDQQVSVTPSSQSEETTDTAPLMNTRFFSEPAVLQTQEIREMLDEYQQGHSGTKPLAIDPTKVKNVIISPDPVVEGIPLKGK